MTSQFEQQLCAEMSNLYAHSRQFCKSEADSHDLVQDTIVKALKYQESYTLGTNLRSWLYTIMRNTFINGWRRTQRKYEVLERLHLEPKAKQSETPDKNLGSWEAQSVLSILKDGMNPAYYEVIFLCDYKGKAYREIAEELAIPLGTVMSRLHRGRKQAQELLQNNYDSDLLDDIISA
jgi:RNA polymerase sigma-70 factor, ECF subfamily